MSNTPFLFVLCGLSRLTVRVAHALHAGGGEVVVLRRTEGADLLHALAGCARVVEISRDMADVLQQEHATRAHALLLLSEDDADNLRALAAAREAAPDVPLVLRTFDPALADVAEAQMGVRRAFSVSALAAPGFLAAAAGADVPETLRLGDADIPLCRLMVTPHSPLVGLTAAGCKARTGCAVLARGRVGAWEPVTDSGSPLKAGDDVLLGGLQIDILRACSRQRRMGRTTKARLPSLPAKNAPPAVHVAPAAGGRAAGHCARAVRRGVWTRSESAVCGRAVFCGDNRHHHRLRRHFPQRRTRVGSNCSGAR